ncbi:MAG: GH3 auxin-responsive promoter family protein, partial [Cellulophaga sp.]
ENAEEALKKVCKKTAAQIKDYTVAPVFMVGREKGAHEWIIEFRKEPADINHFTELLDNALKSLNSDYEAKRYNNITLNMPKVHISRENLFYDWLKDRSKLGGQHKIPRLSNKRDYIDELLLMNK